jgi:hypothetical protein
VFAKEDRARMSRKELYKNSLKKAGHAWKIILEKGLTGTFVSQSSLFRICVVGFKSKRA